MLPVRTARVGWLAVVAVAACNSDTLNWTADPVRCTAASAQAIGLTVGAYQSVDPGADAGCIALPPTPPWWIPRNTYSFPVGERGFEDHVAVRAPGRRGLDHRGADRQRGSASCPGTPPDRHRHLTAFSGARQPRKHTALRRLRGALLAPRSCTGAPRWEACGPSRCAPTSPARGSRA